MKRVDGQNYFTDKLSENDYMFLLVFGNACVKQKYILCGYHIFIRYKFLN